jgi:hypothetical protein
MTKAELMQTLEEIATAEFDGHFTVMKFTTNWRVCFGTAMEAYSYEPGDKDNEMCAGRTFEEAALRAIKLRRGATCSNWIDAVEVQREHDAEMARIEAMTDEELAAEEADFKRLCDERTARNGDDRWARKTIELALGAKGPPAWPKTQQ